MWGYIFLSIFEQSDSVRTEILRFGSKLSDLDQNWAKTRLTFQTWKSLISMDSHIVQCVKYVSMLNHLYCYLPTPHGNNLHGKNLKKKQAACLNWLWDNGAVVTTCLWAIPVINERFTTGKCQEWSIMSNDYYLFSILWFVFSSSHVWPVAIASLVDMAMIALWKFDNWWCQIAIYFHLRFGEKAFWGWRISIVRSRREWLAKTGSLQLNDRDTKSH